MSAAADDSQRQDAVASLEHLSEAALEVLLLSGFGLKHRRLLQR
jgi:hypothetical protein